MRLFTVTVIIFVDGFFGVRREDTGKGSKIKTEMELLYTLTVEQLKRLEIYFGNSVQIKH